MGRNLVYGPELLGGRAGLKDADEDKDKGRQAEEREVDKGATDHT